MANATVNDEKWLIQSNITAPGDYYAEFETADKYVEHNTRVEFTVPDGSLKVTKGGVLTATPSTSDTTYTSDTETAYPIVISAKADISEIETGVNQEGFVNAGDKVTIAGDTETETKTIYIKEGAISATGTAEAIGGGGLELGTALTAAPATGFYVKASASGGASVTTAGWLPVGASAEGSGDAYYPIAKATFSNTETGDYTEVTAPVLVEGGYLYINEGYIENTKMSLADLVPDNATVTNADSKYIYKTVSVYDKDGTLIGGTMQDATLSAITANNATATVNTVTVTNTGTGFKVSGSKTITGSASVAIATEGYATTELTQDGSISGTASVDATLGVIGLGVNVDDDDVEVTPTIKKEDSTAKSGAITTTQPVSGKYVAVSADAITATVNVTPVVNAAGYGDQDLSNVTASSVKAGAAATGTYYVPITSATHSAVAGTPSVTNATATVATSVSGSDGFDGDLAAGILNAAPTGCEYITIGGSATTSAGSLSGVVTCTATEGYIEAGTKTATVSGAVEVNVTDANAKYIKVYNGAATTNLT